MNRLPPELVGSEIGIILSSGDELNGMCTFQSSDRLKIGKGSIPDPKLQGQAMCYYNPHTGDSFPHATCRTCGGSGWVEQ